MIRLNNYYTRWYRKKYMNVKFNNKKSEDFWSIIPKRSHDGNLFSRTNEQKIIHDLIKWQRPKKCIEFGYNVGHSAIIMLDALADTSLLYSFDIKDTTGQLLKNVYKNFTFIHGDSVDKFNESNISDIDFVFIDSLHSYEQVAREIDCIFPKLNIGAILYFDDTNVPDVYEAITDSSFYNDMKEVSNWITDQHLVTPFLEVNGGFYRNKIIRIYMKIK